MKFIRKEHKGQNGKVLIIGGSEDYVGAPFLAGMAAYRTGVDIVTICAPERVAWAINTMSPDLITKKMLGQELDVTHSKEILAISEKYDVIVIGNGLGLKKEFVNKIVRNTQLPLVIDADAIKVVDVGLVQNAIFTPHEKEFEMLYTNSVKKAPFDPSNMESNIKEMQKVMNNNVILLKGKQDIIFTKNRRHLNKTGTNAMTVGGTGDILAGLCAGILAQSKDLFESAKHAAYVNGRAGEYLQKYNGYSFVASEMISEIKRYI